MEYFSLFYPLEREFVDTYEKNPSTSWTSTGSLNVPRQYPGSEFSDIPQGVQACSLVAALTHCSASPWLPWAQRMEEDAPAGFTPSERISYLPQTNLGSSTVYFSFIFKQWHWQRHYLYLLVPESSHWSQLGKWRNCYLTYTFYMGKDRQYCIRCYENVIWLFQLIT